MIDPRLGVYVAVISTRRPRQVQPLTEQIGYATWYVEERDAPRYVRAGAEFVAVSPGGLCAARNAALRAAWAQNVPCVQLSDDLRRLRRVVAPGATSEAPTATRPISFRGAVGLCLDRLRDTPYRLAGCAPTDNAFYCDLARPVGTHHFIVGDFIVVLPSAPLFDEQLRLKEDYDFTMQHLTTYGGVVRCNDLLASFVHRTNAGGAVAVRTPALEQASIAHLKEKWPGAITDHPRRPNEVVLRWKPAAPAAAA